MKLNKTFRFEMRMDYKTHERLKVYASDHDLSMSAAIEKLIWDAKVSRHMRRDLTKKEYKSLIFGNYTKHQKFGNWS